MWGSSFCPDTWQTCVFLRIKAFWGSEKKMQVNSSWTDPPMCLCLWPPLVTSSPLWISVACFTIPALTRGLWSPIESSSSFGLSPRTKAWPAARVGPEAFGLEAALSKLPFTNLFFSYSFQQLFLRESGAFEPALGHLIRNFCSPVLQLTSELGVSRIKSLKWKASILSPICASLKPSLRSKLIFLASSGLYTSLRELFHTLIFMGLSVFIRNNIKLPCFVFINST